MTKKVVVQGLGFVGAVMALVVANSETEYVVIGVDLPSNNDLIDKLNNGIFPISSTDPKVIDYYKKALKKGNFRATSDPNAYADADVVIVDINLDVQKGLADKNGNDYQVDLSGFKRAMQSIADVCKQDVLILVETTVPPGTCQKVVKPIFYETFEKRGLSHGYFIGHSYERVMPGPGYVDSIKNFYRVYSGIDERSADAVEHFLKTIISTDEYPLTRLANTNATEMAKVLENSFRAMNIAFIQEWTEFAEKADVNLFEVVRAIRMRPTHKNIMRPGLGVGGYCLTKDPLLASWASQYLFDSERLPQSETAVRINDQMPLHTVKVVAEYFKRKLENKKILILGISYLQDVGDTRYTPVEPLYRQLKSFGVQIDCHDPFIVYWSEMNIQTISKELVSKKTYDAIIIGTPHSEYFEENGLLDSILKRIPQTTVFDPHGALSAGTMATYTQHNYKIIGRGDV
jgi:UDP-N-acetyl-D-glucosamine dehydrogenase